MATRDCPEHSLHLPLLPPRVTAGGGAGGRDVMREVVAVMASLVMYGIMRGVDKEWDEG